MKELGRNRPWQGGLGGGGVAEAGDEREALPLSNPMGKNSEVGKECAGYILHSTAIPSHTPCSSWSWHLGCTDRWQLRLGYAFVSFVICRVVAGRLLQVGLLRTRPCAEYS